MNSKAPRILKNLLVAAFAILVLWLFSVFGLVNYSEIFRAFQVNPHILLLILLLQGAVLAIFSLRFWLILKSFELHPLFKDVLAANCVSGAIGQWMPASMAVQETLRLGLMFGTDTKTSLQKHKKSTIFIASIQDRIVGFSCVLLLGFVASVFLYFISDFSDAESTLPMGSVFLMGLASFFSALFFILMPYVAQAGWGRGAWNRVQRLNPKIFERKTLNELYAKWGVHGRIHKNIKTFVVSMLALVFGPLTLVLCAHALGETIDFSVALLISPVLAVATLLPISFAGIGGSQLVAAALFGLLGLSPQVAASASLLQAALAAISTTLLGSAFVPSSYSKIALYLKKKDAAVK